MMISLVIDHILVVICSSLAVCISVSASWQIGIVLVSWFGVFVDELFWRRRENVANVCRS